MSRARSSSSAPTLLVAGILLAGAAFFLLRTDSGQEWLGELQRGRHEAALRERVDVLIHAICEGDPGACIPLAHPDLIQQYGTEGVRLRMGLLSAIAQIGKLRSDQVRVDRIWMPCSWAGSGKARNRGSGSGSAGAGTCSSSRPAAAVQPHIHPRRLPRVRLVQQIQVPVAVDVVDRAAGLDGEMVRLDDEQLPASRLAAIPHQRRRLLTEAQDEVRHAVAVEVANDRAGLLRGAVRWRRQLTARAGEVCPVPVRAGLDCAEAQKSAGHTKAHLVPRPG